MRVLSANVSNYDPCVCEVDAVITAVSHPEDEEAPEVASVFTVCDAALAYTCQECGHVGVDVLDGYAYCAQCGMVRDIVLDDCDMNSDAHTHMIVNPLLPNVKQHQDVPREMLKCHTWSSTVIDEPKQKMLAYIKDCATGRSTAAIRDYAQKLCAVMYDAMKEQGRVFRGNVRKGILAACMYFAFSRFESTRSVSEVASMFEVSDRIVTDGIKRASTLLVSAKHLDPVTMTIDKLPSTLVVHWETMLPRFCFLLKMSPEVMSIVTEAYAKIEELRVLHTHTPLARCAAVIWFVVSELEGNKGTESAVPRVLSTNIKARGSVSRACGVSEATVHKCYKKICAALSSDENNA